LRVRVHLRLALVFGASIGALVLRAQNVPSDVPKSAPDAGIVSAKDLAGSPSIEQVKRDIEALAIARTEYGHLVDALTRRQIETSPISTNGAVFQGAPGEPHPGGGVTLAGSGSAELAQEVSDKRNLAQQLEDELKRSGLKTNEINAAVKTHEQILKDILKFMSQTDYLDVELIKAALKGRPEDRWFAIRALGGRVYLYTGNVDEEAAFQRILLRVRTDSDAPVNFDEILLQAQQAADTLTSACADLILPQAAVILSQDQAQRLMGTFVKRRSANIKAPLDWETRHMFDVALQLMAAHIGQGDSIEEAYRHTILRGDGAASPTRQK
jgi:hypothetical protein